MKRIYWLIICMFFPVIGKEVDERGKVEQVKAGNFALSTSQQPGPLISFGQNIVDRGDRLVFLYGDQLGVCNQSFTEMAPSFLYGIRDNMSIFVELTIAEKLKSNNRSIRALEDLIIQFEYAPYSKESSTTASMITLVANVCFLTQSLFEVRSIGSGAPSFFIGFTANHVKTDWYYFTSFGSIIAGSKNNVRLGNQFLYQGGLSRNILYSSGAYIFNWMVELNGVYQQRSTTPGALQDFGGNVLLLGPSLWFSTPRFMLQAGVSFFISQHLFGVQAKEKYYAVFDVAWKF